ncbi:hypothetical protein BV898_17395 [Hypsibius exemplaris]|uniref:Uncharacterized protein n=1 Tax=Hypsibius exemplaris TaxID=2072580 RepID=A0A9X6RM43_HYPEX|nr:hypothetical protein BV898_17395 [Hypsibius exemplaris]
MRLAPVRYTFTHINTRGTCAACIIITHRSPPSFAPYPLISSLSGAHRPTDRPTDRPTARDGRATDRLRRTDGRPTDCDGRTDDRPTDRLRGTDGRMETDCEGRTDGQPTDRPIHDMLL